MKETLKVINQMVKDGVIEEYAIGGAVAAIYYLEPFDTADLEREVDLAERETRDARALEAHDLGVARTRVLALLDRLNPRYAQAIRLRVLEERPRAEAAEALGVSLGTFDVVLHRAMAALRKVLDAEDREP